MSVGTPFVRAIPVSDVPPDKLVSIDVQGTRVLFSNLGGEIHAVSAICTHEEFDLAQGFVLDNAVVCALHLSQFDLRTGEVYNPPATEPLRVFNVKIEENVIFVEV
ncbi:MAG: non-heme iron oxygenase ferredoxin subunit [Thaumarchaeota archaeon]|nr:non-heme iron oxygenase ferredoxin subunit [Nitrososphaerota archaeon]